MTPIDLTTLELTPEQVAQQTGATADRVRRLAAAGKLPSARDVGTGSRSHWVVTAADIDMVRAALADSQGRRTLTSVAQELRDLLHAGRDTGVADTFYNGVATALEVVTGETQTKLADPDAYAEGINPVTIGGDPTPADIGSAGGVYSGSSVGNGVTSGHADVVTQSAAEEAPDDIPHHELDTHFHNAVAGQDTHEPIGLSGMDDEPAR